ncbi:MAG: mannose-6-phosphate isomerase [Bacteroidales bacterium]|nr:mannose-6-phosphate isomerase [Bacteroidales bacterium]
MLYPIKFIPLVKTLVWGSEIWMLSAVEGNESVVANGPEAGKTITVLAEEYKDALLGKGVYERTGARFPLLIKDIVTHDKLSIQVHPDDALAQKRGYPCGKTEMWYIREAEPGASLISGFAEQVTPEQYKALVEQHRITDVLAKHSVVPGDAFFIPAGRIHAIGAGISLYEIQQTSNTTYRIYDYGRPGLDGKPRQLHTEEALDAIDYKVYDDYKDSLPISCPYFTTSLLEACDKTQIDLRDKDSFFLLIGLKGKALLETAPDASVEISEGETVLIPAACKELSVTPMDGDVKLITVFQ